MICHAAKVLDIDSSLAPKTIRPHLNYHIWKPVKSSSRHSTIGTSVSFLCHNFTPTLIYTVLQWRCITIPACQETGELHCCLERSLEFGCLADGWDSELILNSVKQFLMKIVRKELFTENCNLYCTLNYVRLD